MRAGGSDEWAEEPPSGGDFDLRIVFDFLRRRKLVILLVSLPLLIPASIVPFLFDPYYEATATVLIRTPPKVLEFGADFMPGTGGGQMPGQLSGSSTDSALFLVHSDAVLGRVVDQLPPAGEARKTLFQRAKEIAKEAAGREPAAPLTPDQERAGRIEVLRRIASATITGGGSYLSITASGNSSGAATFLANAVADAYVKHQEETAIRRRAARSSG
jgi:uncharacterized protein involved in exopolysaccharide biosynthesis